MFENYINPFQTKRLISAILIIISILLNATDVNAIVPRIHCAEDTAKVSKILKETAENGGSFGQRVVFAASQLAGTPWSKPADNDSIGTIFINLHGMDRLGFINTTLAIAKASMKNMPLITDFYKNYESISRRKGEDNGFASQLIYGADWIVDNVYRGNLKEMTEYIGGGGFKPKTFDYVSRHREEYPALKDDKILEKVKMMEMGYRSHRVPHLKKQSIGNKSIHELMQDGDIILMLSNEIDFDIYDIGFIKMINGEPFMIHISRENGLTTVDEYPISRLFKIEGQHFYGYRWLRPEE